MENFRGVSFRSERDTMVGVLQKARSRAMANIGQSSWGVHYEGSPQYTYTIFRGAAYSAGASTNEVLHGNKGAIVLSDPVPGPLADILFTQLSGTTTGNASAKITENSRSTIVSVHYEGTIIW